MNKNAMQRLLLKLSGEALSKGEGKEFQTISADVLHSFAEQIKSLRDLNIICGVVVGAGNIFRGVAGEKKGFDRVRADRMGMQATIVNALGLEDQLLKIGVPAHVMNARGASDGIEAFDVRVANRYLDNLEVVIFAGGTGNPYFSTDSAAVLRALEIKADAVLKATNVQGVYDSDPRTNTDAKLFKSISWDKALEMKLKVMDLTAFSLASENKMPIVVFDMNQPGNLARVVLEGNVGTHINDSTEIVYAGS